MDLDARAGPALSELHAVFTRPKFVRWVAIDATQILLQMNHKLTVKIKKNRKYQRRQVRLLRPVS